MNYTYQKRDQLGILILILCLFSGCASVKTAGTHNENLTEKKAYQFTYDGNLEDASYSLRRTLLPSGFSIVKEDSSDRGASFVFEKTLSGDEKFETTGMYESMTGVSSGTQIGRLVFFLTKNENNVRIEMTPRLAADISQVQNKYQSSSQRNEMQPKQGHPLPMKYGRKLVENDGWELIDPERSAVFMNE